MAITGIEYSLFRSLRKKGLLPLGCDVLEIGEANWYGDVGVLDLKRDIEVYAAASRQNFLSARLDALAVQRPAPLFEIAKVFWDAFLQPASMTAIDFHGGPEALKFDLNRPIQLERQFGVVLNLGTLEHVFNVAQAMETIHDHTRQGGLMIHGMPLTGWIDHGFYSFNSTFYFDLARANGYEVVLAVYAELESLKLLTLPDRDAILKMAQRSELGANSLLYVLLRKAVDAPFQVPIQGYYAGNISRDAAESWKRDR